jgi:NAD(P)H-dependent flavin oxidoreductase YrpB (nitropropane dioxygenase family)
MRTKLAEDMGLEFPIFAFTHCRDVAAAVSKAGGLGVLGVAGHSLDTLSMELDWIEEQVDGKPYGVDLLLPTKFVGSDRGGLDASQLDEKIPQEHRRFLDGLLEKHGVPPLPPGEKLRPEFSIGYEKQRDVIELAFEHRISLIASALGPPPSWMIEQGHAKGVKVAALAGTVDHARRHAEAGVDIVVAQGTEAGGHTGEISTMVLVPEVVDAVDPLPVLAAGGIGNGRQLTAALALGAQGVWTGSIWLTTEEAETHPVVKEKFLKASSRGLERPRESGPASDAASAAARRRGPGADCTLGPQVARRRAADQLLRGPDRGLHEPSELRAERCRGAGAGVRGHDGTPGRLGPGLGAGRCFPRAEHMRLRHRKEG